ncbi:hypothetical protein BO94DRAFT_59084 [Aspergillus sclerotioniger CBS 115572]|uniref:Uncharacterized protein n=1 Tax=Aspergillus sclerotioniger CBS 115572 TaxID=1450535 RepID=A0A317WUL2_9EURO|nr:hypothetical protein BO94DRAFT_59084 [Aspergillus sclerotioniger CBS 115572]PWY87940.1 hypothetical protein BO94DRAFT_59084 [Aspergillus sclerotioniger CBS 115572]
MFQCSQCNKSYQRKSHLLRHEVTHTGASYSSCPFCNKTFLKKEVARRHSKTCARKHNQPPPAAAKPGRKKQSCDECFSAKAACDRVSPCSRCQSLGKQCSFGDRSTPSTETCSPGSPSTSLSQTQRAEEPFSFLAHFSDPSVKQDKLAIAETAKRSTRRSLDPLYFQDEPLLPIDSNYMPGFSVADLFLQSLPIPSGPLSMEFLPESAFSSRISDKLSHIMINLVETSNSMDLANASQQTLDVAGLASLFTTSNLSVFISAFFQSLHWHLPIVHFPTFDPGKVSNPLLLAIFLSGATYATSHDGPILASGILDVAEEYIFRQLANLSTTPYPNGPPNLVPSLEIIQGALIIEMLQFGQGETGTRRRIRIIRHPCVISTIRSLGIFQSKRIVNPDICDDETWKAAIAEEVRIRIACWAFLADGFLTVCFNNHPILSIFEMDCDFPLGSAHFEAENASTFNEIASSTERSLPSLREFVTRLLNENASEDLIQWSRSLVGEHLLILMYGMCSLSTSSMIIELSIIAMHSLAFQARTGLFGWVSTNPIKRATENWRSIWDSISSVVEKERVQHLGYPKHAEELWWLLTATLDRASGRGLNFRYLENAATDDLENLNDFIRNIDAPGRL